VPAAHERPGDSSPVNMGPPPPAEIIQDEILLFGNNPRLLIRNGGIIQSQIRVGGSANEQIRTGDPSIPPFPVDKLLQEIGHPKPPRYLPESIVKRGGNVNHNDQQEQE